MKILYTLALCAFAYLTQAQLIISQYYHDGGNNKWLEVTNVSDSSIDFSIHTFVLASFVNATYDSVENRPTSNSLPRRALSGILNSGESFLIKNTNAQDPSYALAHDSINGGLMGFNGDDLIILTTVETANQTVAWDNRIDMLGRITFPALWTSTTSSWVRKSDILSPNTDFTRGEWDSIPSADVNNATIDQNARLGAHYQDLVFDNGWANGVQPDANTQFHNLFIIDDTASISQTAKVKELEVSATATLEIEAGAALSATGGCELSGNLHLKANSQSDYAQYQGTLNNTGTGNITWEMVIEDARWRSFSFPVKGANIAQIANQVEINLAGNRANLFYWHGAVGNWFSPDSLQEELYGRGWYLHLRNSFIPAGGGINQDGNLPVRLTITGNALADDNEPFDVFYNDGQAWGGGYASPDTDGWIMRPNPFACHVNWDEVRNQASNWNFSNSYYVWSPIEEDFLFYDGNTGSPELGSYIAPGQTVFVRNLDSTLSGVNNTDLNFTLDMTYTDTAQRLLKQPVQSAMLTVYKGNKKKRTFFGRNSQGSFDFDGNLDSEAFPSDFMLAQPAVNSVSGQPTLMAINYFDLVNGQAEIPLSLLGCEQDFDFMLESEWAGNLYYYIKWGQEAWKPVNLQSLYTRKNTSDNLSGRLLISQIPVSFTDDDLLEDNAYFGTSNQGALNLHTFDKETVREVEVTVYDLAGQPIMHYSGMHQNMTQLNEKPLASGIYLLRIKEANGKVYTLKVPVR